MSARRILFAVSAGLAVPFAIVLFVRALCLVAGLPYTEGAQFTAVLLGGFGILPGGALVGAILDSPSR